MHTSVSLLLAQGLLNSNVMWLILILFLHIYIHTSTHTRASVHAWIHTHAFTLTQGILVKDWKHIWTPTWMILHNLLQTPKQGSLPKHLLPQLWEHAVSDRGSKLATFEWTKLTANNRIKILRTATSIFLKQKNSN